ncbi:hypothetical protein [Mobiluncus mulieris]|uniref:Uncharacterized protein n=2 Tax=Mobiluncus mulieris TaxID=2052 RepID=E0QRR9_9ACTO|nr:hypothetical protein [Mobiluncus mulieris]EEJ54200.1 hypothetical protein HMPREF0577_0920 [Mobiluncus mulieris ATCC 35243]EEZ91135.1 hypothetical protein HMPREF0578_2208 [Mobiluncus mulieris 28-1]EFM45777.1 hypothetical protein HMPREF0580_1584 [Mobiluncus mulieris ATCC 35239]MBB5846042.1 hypothetical protein [Mobiluncus mulieris]MCU9968203.1 hypothetical protein [Mobiluncus mulieris]
MGKKMVSTIKKCRATVCSIILVWSSCGADTTGNTLEDEAEAQEVLSKMAITAEVDPQSATVTLPADRYAHFFPGELARLEDAQVIAKYGCDRVEYYYNGDSENPSPHGFIADASKAAARENGMFNRFGPWTEEMAQRFAYTDPTTLENQVYFGLIPPPPGFLEEQFQREMAKPGGYIGLECEKKLDPEVFSRGRLDSLRPPESRELMFGNLMPELRKTAEFKEALADLKQCYRENGLTVKKAKDESPTHTVIDGANRLKINNKQIDLARKDVQCKTKVDFVNRVAQEAAKIQVSRFAKHHQKLVAWRAEVDKALAKADEVIASHPNMLRAR